MDSRCVFSPSPASSTNSQPIDDEMNRETIIIYMCKNCKSIVGNDRFKIDIQNDGKIIFFTELDNCLMESSVKTSRQVFDMKCRFRNVECAQCHRHLGRQYCEVTEKFKQFLGLIGIAVSEISSTSMQVPRLPKVDVSGSELEKRVKLLEDKINGMTQQIEDLACVCIDACKDRVGIKEAVANLLVLISKELGQDD
ncbi:uncharacterized protein LOC135941375 [Cloeon dipterum]|uniref:uncharacterized protein LOC135941375 n=1 Tax=Cloeon dipterum TaxID=197152 RepID=UPI0032207F12